MPYITGLFARKAPVCILFRRKLQNLVQLIKWNTDDDTFERGGLFNGKLFLRRADLSPDGRYLVYFAAGSVQNGFLSWTAVCKPPFWDPVAFWPKQHKEGGGGLFQSNRKLLLDGEHGFRPIHGIAHEMRVLENCPFQIESTPEHTADDGLLELARMTRDGWRYKRSRIVRSHFQDHDKTIRTEFLEKQFGETILERSFSPQRGMKSNRYTIHRPGEPPSELPRGAWADFDQRGRICYEKDGVIFAIEPNAAPEEAIQLLDLSRKKIVSPTPPNWAEQW